MKAKPVHQEQVKKKPKNPHKHKFVLGPIPGVLECETCGKPKIVVDV